MPMHTEQRLRPGLASPHPGERSTLSEAITSGRIDATEFVPLSTAERGWEMIAGDANACLHTLGENGELWSGVGLMDSCTVRYRIEHPTTIHLLEGKVKLTAGGQVRELGPGDVVFLTTGTTSVWDITSPVREFFLLCAPAGQPADLRAAQGPPRR